MVHTGSTMTSSEALQKFGLPASPQYHDEIRRLLADEIELEKRGESGEEMLRTLCVQLFSLGAVEDALLIWEAKRSSFDAGCGLDIQFLCGAGLPATKAFLARSDTRSLIRGRKCSAVRPCTPGSRGRGRAGSFCRGCVWPYKKIKVTVVRGPKSIAAGTFLHRSHPREFAVVDASIRRSARCPSTARTLVRVHLRPLF